MTKIQRTYFPGRPSMSKRHGHGASETAAQWGEWATTWTMWNKAIWAATVRLLDSEIYKAVRPLTCT
jgi:hypothetical protein